MCRGSKYGGPRCSDRHATGCCGTLTPLLTAGWSGVLRGAPVSPGCAADLVGARHGVAGDRARVRDRRRADGTELDRVPVTTRLRLRVPSSRVDASRELRVRLPPGEGEGPVERAVVLPDYVPESSTAAAEGLVTGGLEGDGETASGLVATVGDGELLLLLQPMAVAASTASNERGPGVRRVAAISGEARSSLFDPPFQDHRAPAMLGRLPH